ncbi:MAG: VWA-like domain-containing protein [Comamonadaceae bacterium]|nr:VWA-like domain-containing protein [Comamonadaceae bacterium]
MALDTSGSIGEDDLAAVHRRDQRHQGHAAGARVTLLACDAELAEGAPWICEPWEEFALPRRFQGGGGTDFTPVFDCDRARRTCAPMCCSTSPTPTATFPDAAPNFPGAVAGQGQAFRCRGASASN